MRLFDTHCHLNDVHAFPEPHVAVEEAVEAGVAALTVVGVDLASSERAVELAERFEGVFATVGWHPNYAADFRESTLPALSDLLNHPQVVALGEIGLDFHWDYATPEQQHLCLAAQLDLAESAGRPLVFHCREANDALLEVLSGRALAPFVWHCFSGTLDHARRAVELGGYLGVDGPVTYPKAHGLREVLSSVPRDRLLIETDSPYMAPHPYRGRPNRPAWLPLVNAGLARTLRIAEEECARLTWENAVRFYRPGSCQGTSS